ERCWRACRSAWRCRGTASVRWQKALHEVAVAVEGEFRVSRLLAVGLRSLEADDQFKFRDLFHGEVSGPCALKNLIHEICGTTIHFRKAFAVGHQTTGL